MTDEFKELYDILSTDNEDVKVIKSNYEKDISMLLGRVFSYHVDPVNVESNYDVDNEFDKYKMDNIFINYNLQNDATDYKISLLQGYLQDLFQEKKFNEYCKHQEEKMSRNEYLEYTHNDTVRQDKVATWYQEFMQR